MVWKHEGCSCGNDPASDLAINETELVFALVSLTFSPQGSELGKGFLAGSQVPGCAVQETWVFLQAC